MRDFIVALGVPRNVISVEERSRNTHENALYTAALVRDWPGTKVLLTSDCHMRRAHAAFRRAGLDVWNLPDLRAETRDAERDGLRIEEERDRISEVLRLAEQLGGETAIIPGHDPVEEILR